MSTTLLAPPATTLAGARWPAARRGALRAALLAAAGVGLLTLSAKVQVPAWPVPFTMQTFAVLVIAMAYGARLGTATVAAYLGAGAAGLPVFAGTPALGVGLPYMVGPTGGFLVGFLVAAWACGELAERGWDRSALRTAAAMTLGTALIFLCGGLWLAHLTAPAQAAASLAPLTVGAALKIALATFLLPAVWRRLGRP